MFAGTFFQISMPQYKRFLEIQAAPQSESRLIVGRLNHGRVHCQGQVLADIIINQVGIHVGIHNLKGIETNRDDDEQVPVSQMRVLVPFHFPQGLTIQFIQRGIAFGHELVFVKIMPVLASVPYRTVNEGSQSGIDDGYLPVFPVVDLPHPGQYGGVHGCFPGGMIQHEGIHTHGISVNDQTVSRYDEVVRGLCRQGGAENENPRAEDATIYYPDCLQSGRLFICHTVQHCQDFLQLLVRLKRYNDAPGTFIVSSEIHLNLEKSG